MTRTVMCSPCSSTATVMRFPRGEYLKAFERRLKKTLSSLSASAQTVSEGAFICSSSRVSSLSASPANERRSCSKKARSSTRRTVRCILPLVTFWKSSIWLMRRMLRRVFFCMISRFWRTWGESSGCSRTFSNGDTTRVNGVRISWTMFVKKSVFTLASFCSRSMRCFSL